MQDRKELKKFVDGAEYYRLNSSDDIEAVPKDLVLSSFVYLSEKYGMTLDSVQDFQAIEMRLANDLEYSVMRSELIRSQAAELKRRLEDASELSQLLSNLVEEESCTSTTPKQHLHRSFFWLRILLPKESRDDILGDIESQFHIVLRDNGPSHAKWFAWLRLGKEVGASCAAWLPRLVGDWISDIIGSIKKA